MPHSSQWLLQLLQRFLKSSAQIQQIHSLLITDGHLLSSSQTPSFSNVKWMSTLFYNTLIRAYLSLGQPRTALLLYTHMFAHHARPNSHTFPSLIKSATISLTFLGKQIHAHAFKLGVLYDPFVQTSLISYYAELGELRDARKVFDEILRPCIVAFNSMLDAFAKNGNLGCAVSLFKCMPEHDVVSWTSVINGFWWNGCFLQAIRFFEKMVSSSVKPNEATYVSILSSCANLDSGGALCRGKEIHAYVIRNEVKLTVFIGTALIDFYGKMGILESARNVFIQIKNKEVCAWNAMISSFASNGRETEALDLFAKMKVEEGIHPNEITYVAILTACARGKLVELGLQLFRSMWNDFAIAPITEHCVCVVDLLSKAGLLREATEFIKSLPFEPDASVLGALLGACKLHSATELGNEVGRRLIAMQPRHCGRYVTLASINAGGEKWDHAADMRRVMAKAGIQKLPAYSRIDPMQKLVPVFSYPS